MRMDLSDWLLTPLGSPMPHDQSHRASAVVVPRGCPAGVLALTKMAMGIAAAAVMRAPKPWRW